MKHYSPHTPSRRHMTAVSTRGLSKEEPMKSAIAVRKSRGGRNSAGRLTMRHKGGGAKRRYRVIDFKRSDKLGIPGVIEGIEYDPNRSSFIMRVLYSDGERRYHISPDGVSAGDNVIASENAPLKPGNRMPMREIPVGYSAYNIELLPGKGGQIVRSAGSGAQILAQDGRHTHIKLPSGEVRKVLSSNFATLGQVSNPDHGLKVIGKAGRKRHMGVRPTVRGTAMNPVDHPYGGGEGRTQRGIKRPKDKWGNVTGGRKTRKKNKYSDKLIVKRRTSKRKKK